MQTSSPKAHKVFPGDRFGYLLVLQESDESRKEKQRHYICRCACGEQKIIRGTRLTSGNVMSCGCQQVAMRVKRMRIPDDGAAINMLYSAYRKKIIKAKKPFTLSRDDLRRLIFSRCHYCGAVGSNARKMNGVYFYYNGVDRIDSVGGYTPDNSVPCCASCNRAKMAMPRDKFLSWVSDVATHQEGNKTVSVVKSYFVVMIAYRDGPEATVDPTLDRADVLRLIRSREAKDIIFIHEIAGSRVIDRTAELIKEALSGTEYFFKEMAGT